MPPASLRYERRFALRGALMTIVEATAVAFPLGAFFHVHQLSDEQRWLLIGAAPGVLLGSWLIWWLALRWWRGPLDAVLRALREGRPVDAASLDAAVRVTFFLPRHSAWLRSLMTVLAMLGLSLLLSLRTGFALRDLLGVVALTGLHILLVQVFRVLAWSDLLGRVRLALLPDDDPLRLFHLRFRAQLQRAGLATGALGFTAVALFVIFFLRPGVESYVQLASAAPLTALPLVGVWLLLLDRLSAPIERYLSAACSRDPRQHPSRNDPRGITAYRVAQALPYQLGGLKLLLTIVGEVLLTLQATMILHVDRGAVVPAGIQAITVTIGAALYEVLWHRATLRPFLAHLAMRHRPSPDSVRTPFGLRTRMLLFLGMLTIFASTLSLVSSFVQSMTLATASIERESELRRDRIVSDLRELAASRGGPLREAEVLVVLAREARRDRALLYYLGRGPSDEPIGFAGTSDGGAGDHGNLGGLDGSGPGAGPAPPLPSSVRARMLAKASGEVQLPTLRLMGSFARLDDGQPGAEPRLGAIAVLYPSYWERGTAFSQHATVLLYFFVLLVIAAMGIVVLVATDLERPIRLLEERAVAMARGDLSRPVVHVAGEVDEVGRLTYAFEEMRRALNEKLRSSTEINLALESEVARRTRELERRNKELHDALDALRRAQAELLRSEKMASMGRLVAGIAHEINNPVNAVVNTVGPLDAALEEVIALGHGEPALVELVADVREMIRVIKSGARRTKEIVSALHNYSRGDDDTRVEVDLHRGLDESLDLLRHYLWKGITVERSYGDVGRVLGNSGQLQQVFMNLVTNAAQAIGDRARGGTIRISTGREGGQVVVRISDDGPGIPEELLPRIFDPFYTTKDVGQGSGLGLSIVHGIVERLGGTIKVESEVGRGTTFTVTLAADGKGEAHGDAAKDHPTAIEGGAVMPGNPKALLGS